MSERHFVKYTFLKLDPAWRRLQSGQRAQHKREFMAACEDFADGHLLQSFSLVGTRGDAELLLISEAENLDRIDQALFEGFVTRDPLGFFVVGPPDALEQHHQSRHDDQSDPRAFGELSDDNDRERDPGRRRAQRIYG